VPNNGFPGLSANTSDLAWPSGRQPWSLECWPKNWTGGYIPCQKVEVLQDKNDKWPGKCVGLTKQPSSLADLPTDPSTQGLCQQNCNQNPLCSTWQTGLYGECWQGVGQNCFVRESFSPGGAQRLQHGEVRKLMDLAGWQIVGLFKNFDNGNNFFLRDLDAVMACKFVCYSDIRCQFWQYSPKYGCYVEDPSQGFSPAYPLTLDWAYRSTSFALDCIAGEFIQHFCPDHLTTAFPTEAPTGISECMHQGVRYDPPDMIFQSRSVEMNARACQTRCRLTTRCTHFAYWPDGGCHLQDENAKVVVAEDFRVISGPPTCDGDGAGQAANTTATHDGSWLTEEGLKALNGGVMPTSAPSVEPTSPLFANAQAAPVVEMRLSINNLGVSTLTVPERQQLQARYLDAISRSLGVPANSLQADPFGPGSLVRLQPAPPTGGQVVTYMKQSTASTDIAQLQANLQSQSLASLLEQSTITVLGSSHGAIRGNLEVVDPTVRLGQFQPTTAPPPEDTRCNFLCMYWPLILGCVFLTCVGGLVAGFLLFKQDQPKKASKKRRALLEADQQSYEGSEFSDGEDGEASVWDTEPSWDSPNRGNPSPPREGDPRIWDAEPAWNNTPTRSSPSPQRDVSLGDMYSSRKGETIFEA